jgi:hypothetical protein
MSRALLPVVPPRQANQPVGTNQAAKPLPIRRTRRHPSRTSTTAVVSCPSTASSECVTGQLVAGYPLITPNVVRILLGYCERTSLTEAASTESTSVMTEISLTIRLDVGPATGGDCG